MSSNLVKSYYTTKESSTPRVIDGNAKVEQALERIRYIYSDAAQSDGFEGLNPDVYGETQDGYAEGIDADMLSGLVDDNSGVGDTFQDGLSGLVSEDGSADGQFSSNVIKAVPNQPAAQSKEDVMAEVDALRHRLLEETLADIAAMKDQAAEDIARERVAALEEAKEQGYAQGREQAYAELEQARRELEHEKEQHEKEFADTLFELEPKFVRLITNIYEKVFQVDLAEEKEIVVNLLKTAMQKVEGSKNYMIHVSKDDYKFVYDNKKVLAEAAMAEDAIIDVVEDLTMKSGDCFIETANGIFDCGVETQLTSLKKKLMLLAYDGR